MVPVSLSEVSGSSPGNIQLQGNQLLVPETELSFFSHPPP